MKNKRTRILLGGMVLISAAFLLLDFRVAVSDTQANRLVVVTEAGENVPFPMQRNHKISMVLVGEGPLVRALQKALTEKMDKAGIGQIELVQEIDHVSQNPALVVKVGKPGAIWTPFFAMSQLTIHAGYASNGDTNFMELAEKSHTTVGNPDHSILNLYAEYEVNDRSLGLISRLGYHQFLAEYLAEEIVAALQDLYLASYIRFFRRSVWSTPVTPLAGCQAFTSVRKPTMDKSCELKQLLSAADTLVMPDAFDPISAKLIEYVGFKIGMRRVCIGKNAYMWKRHSALMSYPVLCYGLDSVRVAGVIDGVEKCAF